MIPRLEKDWKLKSYLGSAFSSPTNFVGVMAKGRFSPPVAQAIVNVCPDADTVGDALNELYKIALIKDRTESVLYNVLFVKLIEEMTPIKRREKLSIFYGAMKDDKAPMVVLDPITHDATCFLIYKPFHDDVKDETSESTSKCAKRSTRGFIWSWIAKTKRWLKRCVASTRL